MPIMDWKLELVTIPVSDVDQAKTFYTEKLGFNADHDHRVGDDMRFVQLTPPGSACSIDLGTGLTEAAPGSAVGVQLVVSDIEAAHAQLASGGVEVSDVQVFPWGSFVFFADPDGNKWAVQQLPPPDPASERVSNFASDLKGKSQDFLQKHDERIESAIDKTAGFVDDKTKGKYSDRIGSAAGEAKAIVDKLAGKAQAADTAETGDAADTGDGAQAADTADTAATADTADPVDTGDTADTPPPDPDSSGPTP
jgi:catechol 2,3-dioxygenase-like lactoylglutathione lyase family enzyme